MEPRGIEPREGWCGKVANAGCAFARANRILAGIAKFLELIQKIGITCSSRTEVQKAVRELSRYFTNRQRLSQVCFPCFPVPILNSLRKSD